MRGTGLFLGLVLATAAGLPAAAQTVDRLYVMDCGHNAAHDQARWSPGVNVGKPIELSDNCYLIKHGAEWLLWDTGYPDAVADKPVDHPTGTATRAKKLAAQLAELRVKPADITFVAVSHTHGDHVGNVDMFPTSTLLIQKPEVDWAFAEGKQPPFKTDRPIRSSSGDLDVFGDGSVDHPVDARPHARPPVAAGASAEDRLGGADRRSRALQGQLGQRPRASMNTSADQTQASHAQSRRSWPTRRRSSGSTTTCRKPGPEALAAVLRLTASPAWR